MKKHARSFLLLFILLLALPLYAANLPHFSSLIVFGDSFSDIGNFPESRWVKAPHQNMYMNNLYIPVSNPINQSHLKRYHVEGTHFFAPYPKRSEFYPSAQPPIKGINRDWHSISWDQYFLALAQAKKLTISPGIIPSKYLHTLSKQQQKNVSVNYAWFGAMSTPECNNNDQDLPSQCNRQKAWQTANRYRQGQTVALKHQVHIPGVDKQINFFLSDR